MAYRDELEAARARADALEEQLEAARAEATAERDRADSPDWERKIESLERQRSAASGALQMSLRSFRTLGASFGAGALVAALGVLWFWRQQAGLYPWSPHAQQFPYGLMSFPVMLAVAAVVLLSIVPRGLRADGERLDARFVAAMDDARARRRLSKRLRVAEIDDSALRAPEDEHEDEMAADEVRGDAKRTLSR